MQECDTPYCNKLIPQGRLKRAIKGYHFCKQCRTTHSYRVLIAQAEHKLPIREALLEASTFRSAGGMASYLGVSFVTIYHWIIRYFGLTFQEFRRKYVCKRTSRSQCYLLDIRRSSYSRHDYVLKKIRSKRYCACINALDSDLITTNAPLEVIQSIWRGSPRIDRISDDMFALVPFPIKFLNLYPIYFDLLGQLRALKHPKRKAPSKRRLPTIGGEKFFDKLITVLVRLGGEAPVEELRRQIRTARGVIALKNNTRREVYKHPDLLEFVPGDDQSMRLTEEGKEVVEKLKDQEK